MGNARVDGSRDRILAAALHAFAEHGFAGARVAAIARAAGVNKALLYYHVGGKETLYAAAIGELLPRLKAQIAAGARHAEPLERIVGIYVGLGRVLRDNPFAGRIILREILDGGRHLPPVVARTMVGTLDAVLSAVRAGVDSGRFGPVNPFLLHLTMVGSLLIYVVGGPFRARIRGTVGGARVPRDSWPDLEAHVRNTLTATLTSGAQRSRRTR